MMAKLRTLFSVSELSSSLADAVAAKPRRARAAAQKAEAERLEAQKAAAEKAERKKAAAERKKAAAERKKAEAERKKAEAERKAAARAEAEARRKAEAEARAAFEREAELLGAEEEKHADDDYDDARVVETLAGLGLASYLPLFREQEIDDGALLGLEADDLSDMGVAPAAALRILSAINALRMAASKLAVNEVMDDSARHQAVLEAELKDHRARIAKLQLADVPEDLLCCISCEIMKDPVSADDGNTYERVCIEQWFATGKRTSPRTNEPLESLKLRPNHAIRRLTATYLESRGKDF